MIGKLKIAILTFCLFGISFHLSAQQYGYVQYRSTSGAPFDRVSSVIQDSDGYVWIGSENGLYRFDGIHYDNYSLNSKSQFINQLHREGDTLLFLNELSLYRIDQLSAKPVIKVLLEGSIHEDESRPFYPNDFILSQAKEIWISQSNHSIGRFGEGGFKSYPFSASDKAQKLSLQEDPNGGIWALSPLDGLFHYNESRATFEKKADIKNGVSLAMDNEFLFIGSDALHIFSLQGNTPVPYRTIPLDGDVVTTINTDHQDHYFIGTRQGKLYKLSDVDDALQTIYGANEAHRVEELDFGPVHEIHITTDPERSDHTLWVGTDTGLWLLQQRFFKTVENLPMNNPIGIAMGKDGNAWVPMNYLYEIRPEGEDHTAGVIYDNMQANAVAQDKDGGLWVSTVTPKVELMKFDGELVKRRYDFHDRGEAIFYLYPDSKGNLWFCQAPVDKPIIGVARINARGEVEYYDDTKGFSSRVLAIKESTRGEIYAVGIGEDSYLYRYDPTEDRFENVSPPLPFEAMLNFEAHDLTIDDRGIVWLATTDGLLRYDSEKITLIEDDIFTQEEVRGVTHIAKSSLWVATATRGLVFHHEGISTALGEQEGLPASISAYRCITTDADGRLWAGTAEGLVYSRISAAELPVSNTPRIRRIGIQGKEYTKGSGQVLRLRKNQELHLQFTNLSFPAKNVQYQYRIIPEKDRQIMLEEQLWQVNGSKNTLRLIQTGLGDYFMELRARQSGGYQWSDPLEIRFKVFLPWYMRSWFLYTMLGLLLILMGYYFRFFVMRRFKRLQNILKYSNEKLASKEAQLSRKIQEFEKQREELENANSNIQTLELFIKEIPEKATWNDIVAAMGKAVQQADDIDAFEIAFKEKNEIVHRGFSNQERSGYTFRSSPFNAKTSLTCWAMTNDKEVLINDFEKDHTIYIQGKEAYHFSSMLFIPFTLENNQPVVLCAYSTRINNFDPNDLIMFRILARFIHFSIHRKLTKK